MQQQQTPSPASSQVAIRVATPDDIPFIYSTWLRSYKHDSPITKYTGSDLFFAEHQKRLDRLLANTSTVVVVACSPDDPQLIFGYLAYQPDVVHFVYVKKSFRQIGIARNLLDSQGIDLNKCQTSHCTYALIRLWNREPVTIRYNQYLLEGIE